MLIKKNWNENSNNLEKKILEQKEEIKKLQNEYLDKNKLIFSKKETNEKLLCDLSILKKKNILNENKISTFQIENLNLKSNIQEKELLIENLKKENEELKNKIENLIKENKTINENLQKENEELKNKIEDLIKENKTIDEKLKKENEEFKINFDNLFNENKILNEENQNLKIEIEKNQIIKEKNIKNKEILNKVKNLKDEINKIENYYISKLNKNKNEKIQKRNLSFDSEKKSFEYHKKQSMSSNIFNYKINELSEKENKINNDIKIINYENKRAISSKNKKFIHIDSLNSSSFIKEKYNKNLITNVLFSNRRNKLFTENFKASDYSYNNFNNPHKTNNYLNKLRIKFS